MACKEQTSLDLGYLTVKQLADKIGFHPDTVYEWISTRGMPVRRAGRKCRITVMWTEFEKWWRELRND